MNESNPFAVPSEDDNPYRATHVEAPAANTYLSEAHRIREEHIQHEASIKGIGGLYLIGALFWTVMGLFALGGMIPGQDTDAILILLFVVPFCVLLGFAGFGMRGLKPWGKWISAFISAVGLVGVPVGTLISLYILYLLFSQKGQTVFSPEYKDIIAQTPGVRAKTSVVVWIVLGLFVLAIVSVLVTVLFSVGAPR